MRVRKVVTPSGKRLEKFTDLYLGTPLSPEERFHLDNGQEYVGAMFLESVAAVNLEPCYSPRSKASVERAFHALKTNSLRRFS